MTKQKLISHNQYLFWDVPESSISGLSDKSLMIRFLNYSKNLNEVLMLFDILGREQSKEIFEEIKSSKRSQINRRTENYFTLYFAKHV